MLILNIIILLLSITFHEYAHGMVAFKLGDPTPKESGRLSLNPLVHIDIFGTVIMPITLLFLSRGAFSFGFAKPIPVNPLHFRNPKKDILWVGLAGPMSNLFIAVIALFIAQINVPFLRELAIWVALLNCVLCFFNLLPIPPLDGSKVIASFLPYKTAYQYLKMETLGFIIILLLVATGLFKWLIIPIIKLFFTLFAIKGIL